MVPWYLGKWALRSYAAAAVLLTLLAWGWHRERQGRAEGKAEQEKDSNATWSKKLNETLEADRKQTEQQLDEKNVALAEARGRAAASESMGRELARGVAAIQAQRLQLSQSLAALPDAELHGHIVSALKVRKAEDQSAGYYPAEERVLADYVDQYPAAQRQIEKLGGQVAANGKDIAATKDQVRLLEEKYASLAGYTGRVEGAYVTLYNAFPRTAKSWKCLKLWSCGKAKPLPTPDPVALRRSGPSGD